MALPACWLVVCGCGLATRLPAHKMTKQAATLHQREASDSGPSRLFRSGTHAEDKNALGRFSFTTGASALSVFSTFEIP